MKYAAFFRNVNLGQGKNPTRAQLEAAFLGAGAESAQSFLSNGTLVFTVEADETAHAVAERAREALKSLCGLEEPVYICTLQHLAGLVDAGPFAAVERETVYQYCASFLPSGAAARLHTLPRTPKGEVEVVRVAGETVLSVTRKVEGRTGNATAFLEGQLGVPATTRNWNTIVRLIAKNA